MNLVDSGPIRSSRDGEVIQGFRIKASGSDAIRVTHNNVTIRNCAIEQAENFRGISAIRVSNLLIDSVDVVLPGPRPRPSLRNSACSNIYVERSGGVAISAVRLTGGSSGIYAVLSPEMNIKQVRGYNFTGPFPRGQLLQWNQSPNGVLFDFACYNDLDPDISWPEDNLSAWRSPGCRFENGVIDGNNSTHGVGVMVEHNGGVSCVDVDVTHVLNGAFSAAAPGVFYDSCRTRDNYNESYGRGKPSSNGLTFASLRQPASSDTVMKRMKYFNPANPNNMAWEMSRFAEYDATEEDFELKRMPDIEFPWETEPPPTPNPDVMTLKQYRELLEMQISQIDQWSDQPERSHFPWSSMEAGEIVNYEDEEKSFVRPDREYGS